MPLSYIEFAYEPQVILVTRALSHPHLDIVYEPFVWNQMRDPSLVTLVNPQSLVDGPCEVLGPKSQDIIFTSLGTGAIV